MSAQTSRPLEPPRRMTDDEWASMDEDDSGELVDGVLVEEEVPDWAHEIVVGWLMEVLRAFTRAQGGFVGGSEIRYILRGGRGRKPDLSIFLASSPPPPRSGPTRRPPDVMIEVVSKRPRDVRRDRLDKMAEYAAFGVKWYWVVDPQVRMFEVHELGPTGRYIFATGGSDGRVQPPGCDALELDLDAMWAEIDRLGPSEADDE